MKKLLILLLTLAFVFALSACNNKTFNGANKKDITSNELQKETTNSNADTNSTISTQQITRDRAIEIALNHAGLSKNEVYDLDAELEYERNIVIWDVDFEYGKVEYSYDINAQTEEIIKYEKD